MRHFLAKSCDPPQVHLKNRFSNFDLKLFPEEGLNEASLFWKFWIFQFLLSRDTSIRKFFSTSLIAENVKYSYLRIEATEKFETFRINYSHSELSLRKVSSRNSKIDFSGEPEGYHSNLLQNGIKIKYLDRNKLGTRTHFKVFIAH